MLCPIDNTQLVMSTGREWKSTIARNAGGVWLDRGELDKIIERSVAAEPVRTASGKEHRSDEHSRDCDHDRDRCDYDDYGHGKPYRKKTSLLNELFDF